MDVPAGTYDLSVSVPGMKSFRRTGVVVAAGATVQLDVRLEDTLSLRTLGEDPTAIVATYFNRPDPPKGPTPRLMKGKPNVSGVWLGGPLDLSGLDLQPWAEALLAGTSGQPHEGLAAVVLPAGGSGAISCHRILKLVHHPATLVFMVENATGFTQMLLDGRPHPPSVGPNWLGHSVGTWDGDALGRQGDRISRSRVAQFRRPAAQRPAACDRADAASRPRTSPGIENRSSTIRRRFGNRGRERDPALAPNVELQESLQREQQRRGTPGRQVGTDPRTPQKRTDFPADLRRPFEKSGYRLSATTAFTLTSGPIRSSIYW